jgi:hypothetical protein
LFSAKSAQALEKKLDELPALAKERKIEERAHRKEAPHPRSFCMNIKRKKLREQGFARV